MLRALIKKDILKFFSTASSQGSLGRKKRSRKGSLIFGVVLFACVLFGLALAFFGMCLSAGDVLIPLDMEWLYFSIIGVTAFVLSLIGNSFTAYSMLFKAGDNDLLLSMPIPPSYILLSRTFTLFVMAVLYGSVVLVPSLLARNAIVGSLSAAVSFDLIALIFVNAFFVSALSALLGWLMAFLSGYIKNKSIATVAFTLIFLAAYYYFYFNINRYIQKLVASSLEIGSHVQSNIFALPVYHFGLAAAGSLSSLLFCASAALVFFAVVYVVLSKSFLSIAAGSERRRETVYAAEKQANIKLGSAKKALFKKELSHFLASPTYMINCGLGTVLMIASAVAAVIKSAYLREMAENIFGVMPELAELLPLVIMAVMCLAACLNDITAPSVSLEGKRLWILKSIPVDVSDIFYAKQTLQFVFTAPPAMILLAVLAFTFRLTFYDSALIAAGTLLFIELNAICGLALGLRFPKLEWSSEAVPVKQSIVPLVLVFGGAAFVFAVGALYYFALYGRLEPSSFMMALVVLMAVLARLLARHLKNRGEALFMAL